MSSHTFFMPFVLLLAGCGSTLAPGDTSTPGDTGTLDADRGDILPPLIEGDDEEFYADGAVQHLELELSDESMDDLRREPREWAPATVVWEGRRYGPVGVRIKGESTFREIDEKPSLKVKFSEYEEDGRFMGMRQLTLNNMVGDPSMIRERISFRFFRERGMVAPRSNHTTLALNGIDYGLYENVENTDIELLKRWYDDSDGPMWEIHDADFQPGLTDGFESEEGEDDRTRIEGLTAALAEDGDMRRLGEFVNEDQWFRYFATVAYMGNLDGYPFSNPGDDSHIFLNPADGLFQFIPHGLDETFSDDAAVEYVMHGILATGCLSDVDCKATWRAALADAIDDADHTDMQGWVDQIVAEIDSYGDADPRKEFTDAEADEARAYVKEFIALRAPDLEEQLTWGN